MRLVRLGLDWRQVAAVMALRNIPQSERAELLDKLRVMEATALDVQTALFEKENGHG